MRWGGLNQSNGKTVNYAHSQYRHVEALRERDPEPWVRIRPEDAETRGIEDGGRVRISSPRGSIRMKAQVTDATLSGVASISPHWGESFHKVHINMLIDDGPRDPVTGSTGDRSFLCEATKI